jgi:hypothetical protein
MALLAQVAFIYFTNGIICFFIYIIGVTCLESEPIFDVYRNAVGLLANEVRTGQRNATCPHHLLLSVETESTLGE